MEEAIEWLRQQIEGDRAAALIISCGGFAPERWDTDPQGQVNPEHMPEAAAIDALFAADDDDRAFPLHGYWVAMHSWERENCEPEEDRVRGSDLPTVIVNDGRREADHIRRHDPRNIVARCDAELVILNEYVTRDEDVDLMLGPDVLRQREWAGLRLAVRLLASGYQYRDGYAQHWAR